MKKLEIEEMKKVAGIGVKSCAENFMCYEGLCIMHVEDDIFYTDGTSC